tara:strand:+ start:40 stop:513 length:474 start_codon:yes stop_codon:yes gene_type:complete
MGLNKIRVFRGIENIKPDIAYPQSGKYFSTRPDDAIDFASRRGTVGGKVSFLDLTKDEFNKAKNLANIQKTQLSGEVIVDEDMLSKQKTDILKTIKARGSNLSKLAVKGLAKLATLPAALVLNLFSTSNLNEGEIDRTLELLGESEGGNIDKSLYED